MANSELVRGSNIRGGFEREKESIGSECSLGRSLGEGEYSLDSLIPSGKKDVLVEVMHMDEGKTRYVVHSKKGEERIMVHLNGTPLKEVKSQLVNTAGTYGWLEREGV